MDDSADDIENGSENNLENRVQGKIFSTVTSGLFNNTIFILSYVLHTVCILDPSLWASLVFPLIDNINMHIEIHIMYIALQSRAIFREEH